MSEAVDAELKVPGATEAQLEGLAEWIREAIAVAVPAVTALTQLVAAVHGWMTASRGKAPAEVTITAADGTSVTIKGSAPLPEVIAQAQAAFAAAR